MKGRPDDWTSVVRKEWRHLTAYIVSSRHPSCVRMAQDEVRFIDRRMTHAHLDQILSLSPGPHWFMAVIVCPGDDLSQLASWAIGREAERVHFYLHKESKPVQLTPWRDAGLPLSRISTGWTTWGPLHKELGLDLNDQVYGDFAP